MIIFTIKQGTPPIISFLCKMWANKQTESLIHVLSSIYLPKIPSTSAYSFKFVLQLLLCHIMIATLGITTISSI